MNNGCNDNQRTLRKPQESRDGTGLHQMVLVRIEARTALDSLREADAFEVLAEQYSALSLAEANERNARLVLCLAQLDVNAMRDELRLSEITQ